ncbi:MAG: shikimate kinase [Erythrobacter sp.]|nr:shikimate kinase [Erythrobacter sp.]
MSDEPNYILLGLRASGKSTLGKLLAQHLGRDFVDLDDVVAQRMNASGPGEAIERDGIDAFRTNETEALRSVLESHNQVIALGGGTPTALGAADVLSGSGSNLIYLRGLPETLRDRLTKTDNTDRPALVGDDALSEVQTLFDQRDAKYQEIATSIVHIDGVSEDSVLRALVALSKPE